MVREKGSLVTLSMARDREWAGGDALFLSWGPLPGQRNDLGVQSKMLTLAHNTVPLRGTWSIELYFT